MQQRGLLNVLQARGYTSAICAGLLGAVLLLLLSRGLLSHAPHYDELLHILAARGLLDSGQPTIDQGIYARALLYSQCVAWSIQLFGDNLVATRLPGLAAVVALVFVMGAWITRRFGWLSGLVTAVLLCVVPTTVSIAVFTRFYAFHALVIVLMFISLFEASDPGRSRGARASLWAFSIALLALGWHLHQTAVVAAGAALTGVLALLVHDQWPRIQPIIRRYPLWTVAAIGLAVTMAIGVIWLSGLLVKMEEAPLWAMGRAHRLQYYLIEFGRILPLLWPVLPLAAAVAIAEPAQRRLSLYCLVVAISALVVHSIAAPKAIRYVYYFLPLFCVLWACAVAAVLTQADRRGRPRGTAIRLEPLAVIVLMALGIAVSQEGVRTINLAAGRLSAVAELPFADEPDWRPALAELLPMARRANRVVTSNSVKALYYLGRYDFELNATIVPETRSRQEFGVDVRTGRRAIGRPESIERVLDESGDTMVVIETKKIGRTSGVTAEAIAVVESRCEEIPLSAEAGVRAWACNAAR